MKEYNSRNFITFALWENTTDTSRETSIVFCTKHGTPKLRK